jgi:hypothetical protein
MNPLIIADLPSKIITTSDSFINKDIFDAIKHPF